VPESACFVLVGLTNQADPRIPKAFGRDYCILNMFLNINALAQYVIGIPFWVKFASSDEGRYLFLCKINANGKRWLLTSR
jgi:hypothetical protein